MNGDPGPLVQKAVAGAIALYGLVLLVAGIQTTDDVKTAAGAIPLLFLAAFFVWDRWAWRWPLLIRLHRRPRLDGSWTGTVAPGAGRRLPKGSPVGPIPCEVTIAQTFWSLHVTLQTAESQSYSWSESVTPVGASDSARITYFYDNEPNMAVRSRSQQHDGAVVLVSTGNEPRELRGTYFNSRNSAGDIRLNFIHR